MDRYITYCTPEQVKKALELGAPIKSVICGKVLPTTAEKCHLGVIEELSYDIPTAEQMIGWLEENNIENIIVCKKDGGDYGYTVYHTSHRKPLQRFWFSNRKEATLAAIDAALEYLTKNKKII